MDSAKSKVLPAHPGSYAKLQQRWASQKVQNANGSLYSCPGGRRRQSYHKHFQRGSSGTCLCPQSDVVCFSTSPDEFPTQASRIINNATTILYLLNCLQKVSTLRPLLSPQNSPVKEILILPHFTDEGAEALRKEVTCLRSYSRKW